MNPHAPRLVAPSHVPCFHRILNPLLLLILEPQAFDPARLASRLPLFIYLSSKVATPPLRQCVTRRRRRQAAMIAITYISLSCASVMGEKVARRPRYLIAGIVYVQVLKKGGSKAYIYTTMGMGIRSTLPPTH